MKIAFLSILLLSTFTIIVAQPAKLANKPLFRDPVYDGATDPTIIWNSKEKKWFMFYTSRRAKDTTLSKIAWVHGSTIGIAESSDGGATWKYKDTCDIDYRKNPGYTFWAPEIVQCKGLYHMFLSYVPGIFDDWRHPRNMIHLTSTDLIHWKFEMVLKLASEKVIDACLFELPDGTWRMWYNNEADKKSIYFADSPDLYNWTDKTKVVADQGGEGPNVFRFKDKNWMITDVWDGFAQYSSDDLLTWKRIPGNLLRTPGNGVDDKVKGNHAQVVVNNGHAYIIYFTTPGNTEAPGSKDKYDLRRCSVQIAELEYSDGALKCDRNKPVFISLVPPKEK
jgi:sucrose-6-phosphate hydrolase SacC (GH32 family)